MKDPAGVAALLASAAGSAGARSRFGEDRDGRAWGGLQAAVAGGGEAP